MKLLIFAVWFCLIQAMFTQSKPNCRPLQVSFCQNVGYSTSASPTGVLGYNLRDIEQIVETSCSSEVASLMCRVVVPECGVEEDNRLKPCRSLCEKVKGECEATLKAKRIYWPAKLRCESLPEDNCVQVKQCFPLTCARIL